MGNGTTAAHESWLSSSNCPADDTSIIMESHLRGSYTVINTKLLPPKYGPIALGSPAVCVCMLFKDRHPVNPKQV